jgi:hypothetical protein
MERLRRDRLVVCLLAGATASAVQALSAGALAARDPIAEGPRASLLVLGAAAALTCARVFLFVVLPAWAAGGLVARLWDAHARRRLARRE